MKPLAYRIDGICRDGDPAYYSPETFARESFVTNEHAVWPLYDQPQPGCPAEVEVYYGPHFVRPKHDYSNCKNDPQFKALYRGEQMRQHAPPVAMQ